MGGEEVIKEATCTEDGEVVYTCSCGEKKTVVVKKLGHDIQETITEPSYLKQGRIDYQCSRCKATDLKESVTLARLDAAGLGGELILASYYGSYVILPDNKIEGFFGPLTPSGDYFILKKQIADYEINEIVTEDNTVSYSISFDGGSYPVTERDGNVFVAVAGTPESPIEMKLEEKFHEHNGTISTFLTEDDTITNLNTPCQYFDCKNGDEYCLFKIGEDPYKVRVVVSNHDIGSDNKCKNCGAIYNSGV